MTKDEKKQLAKSHYMSGKSSRKQIAALVGITEKTLRTWIDNGNWEEHKNANTITRPALLQAAFRKLNAVNKVVEEKQEGIPDKNQSDSIGIILKEIETFSKNPLHLQIDVMRQYNEYITKHNPKEAANILPTTNDFIEHQAEANND